MKYPAAVVAGHGPHRGLHRAGADPTVQHH